MLRRHAATVLLLLTPAVGAVGLGTYLSWGSGPGGALATAIAASLGAASGLAACAFALDAARIRRAFMHLRAGGAALGWEPPERQRAREARQHEVVAHLRRQVEQLSAIRDLALIANDDTSFERILERALVVLGGLLDAREIAIFLLEGPERQPVAVAHRLGERVRVRGERPLAVAPEDARRALDERRTVVEAPRGAGLRAAALLVADGEVMGALEVRFTRGTGETDPRELARELEGLAKHIALAIRKPTLYDRAVVDSLTKLYTKRHFLEQVQQHMAQRVRLGTPLSLLILDVDRFKQVNDVHGHVAGDRVLAEVARRVKGTIRGYDQAFRYGGEEVVVLAPGTALDDAVGLAERLRRTLRQTPMDAGEVSLKVTASFGVAEYDPERHPDLAALIEEADRCLYRAKHGGRDRVESPRSAEPPLPDAVRDAEGVVHGPLPAAA